MRSRLLRLAAVVVFTFTLAGCGDADEDLAASTTTSTSNPSDATTVLVCLDHDATSDEVQDLFDRASVPSSTGVGTDLLDGITAIAARPRGIAVELDARITADRRAEVIAILEEEPDAAVREGQADCG